MAQVFVNGKHAGDESEERHTVGSPVWEVLIRDPLAEAAEAQGAEVLVEILDNYGNLHASTGTVRSWSATLAVIAGTDEWTRKATTAWNEAVEDYRRERGP